jgi:hypothetical protein
MGGGVACAWRHGAVTVVLDRQREHADHLRNREAVHPSSRLEGHRSSSSVRILDRAAPAASIAGVEGGRTGGALRNT